MPPTTPADAAPDAWGWPAGGAPQGPTVAPPSSASVPQAGPYRPSDANIAAAAVLGNRWASVVLLGHWAGGRALATLWRARSVHPEGDGFVVMFDDDVVLTVAGIGRLQVVRTPGTVELDVASAETATLTRSGVAMPGSFHAKGRGLLDARTGKPARWAQGPIAVGGGIRGSLERRLAAKVGRGVGPRVRLVAVI